MYVEVVHAYEYVRRRSIYVVQRLSTHGLQKIISIKNYLSVLPKRYCRLCTRNGALRVAHIYIRSIIITFVTMKVSPSVLATCCWAVLASSVVWVSVKYDDLEATVFALSCTLLRFCFFSSEKKWKFTTYSFR